jgi:hypothetical protein
MPVNTNYLRIPLHKLYYIDDVDAYPGLSVDELISLKEKYTEEAVAGIVKAVEWAVENKGYDFSSMLPNLNHSNDDIYKYLCVLNHSLKQL